MGCACGLCVASGERSSAGIPGPVETLPTYRGQLLHAIVNMRTWPTYVERMGYNLSTLSGYHSLGNSSQAGSPHVRCAVLVRDPLSRIRSLYTYARSGGEHWFRYESGLMNQLSNQSLTLQQSLDLFWSSFGKAYLEQSHEYTMMNIHLGCTPVKMEDFKSTYNDTLARLLRVYGVNQEVIPALVERLASADESSKSPEELRHDAHFTSNKFSVSFIREVKERLWGMPSVKDLIVSQKGELSASGVHY